MYLLTSNRNNPVGYQAGLDNAALIDLATVHEATHALCDLSYTSNNKISRLGTWNDPSGEFSELSKGVGDHLQILYKLDEAFANDETLRPDHKKILLARIGYGSNLVDIDTVVNELCVLVSLLDLSPACNGVGPLIEFAELNLLSRQIGRAMQLDEPRLRA